jgi:hypothetical protein
MKRMPARPLVVAFLAFVTAGVLWAAPDATYVPVHIFRTGPPQPVDLETVIADISHADVVFLGEDATDPDTHRIERQILEGLARRRDDVVLALEMFERDVQEPLDHFQMGHVDEADFLREARPWPRYATDYKPLVDFAIARQWPVVAANAPRRIVEQVSTSGLAVLDRLPAGEQALVARDRRCEPQGQEFVRFRSTAGRETPGRASVPSVGSTVEHEYAAACLQDETMGDSIAMAYASSAIGGKRPLVVSVNGVTHTDFREGLVARTARRLAGKRFVVVAIRPVADLDGARPAVEDRQRADYLVYTAASRSATGRPGAAPSAGSSSSAP